MLIVDWDPAFRMLAESPCEPSQGASWALAVHHAIARAAAEMVSSTLRRDECRVIALSGGVFMNRILNDLLTPRLEALGLRVLRHRQTPPGDGCIALGQAVVAGV